VFLELGVGGAPAVSEMVTKILLPCVLCGGGNGSGERLILRMIEFYGQDQKNGEEKSDFQHGSHDIVAGLGKES